MRAMARSGACLKAILDHFGVSRSTVNRALGMSLYKVRKSP